MNISYRGKLLFVYFLSMASLLLLNIVLSAFPISMSDNGINMMFALISQCFCMGVIPIVGAHIVRRNHRKGLVSLAKDWQYKSTYSPKVWLIILPLCISFYFVTQLVARLSVLGLLLGQFQFPVSGGTIYRSPWELVKWIAFTALLPAIFEELTHRGLALDALFDRGNEVEAVLLSALLFAAMHTNIVQFLYAFVGGCILGYVVVKSGSIFPAMVLHFFNNAVSCMSEYGAQHPDSGLGWMDMSSDFMTSIPGLAITIVLLIGNLFICIGLLGLLPKLSGKPDGVSPMTIRIGKKQDGLKISLDGYRPQGKATLADNIMLYAVLAMTVLSTLFTYVWGVLR